MVLPEDPTWQLLTTNFFIGFAVIQILQTLIRFWPSRAPTRFQLSVAFAAIYALAIAVNIALPDLFDAIGAFILAQPICASNMRSCYAAGGASWTDNFTLQNPRTLVVCNQAFLACYNASLTGFLARVLGYSL